jgi:hypothetical protein
MLALNIKPTHKPIKNYYAELKEYEKIGAAHQRFPTADRHSQSCKS